MATACLDLTFAEASTSEDTDAAVSLISLAETATLSPSAQTFDGHLVPAWSKLRKAKPYSRNQ